MLYHTKSIAIDNTTKIVEFREGCSGGGNTIYIVCTYYTKDNSYYNYFEERFNNYNEAITWYNNIN